MNGPPIPHWSGPEPSGPEDLGDLRREVARLVWSQRDGGRFDRAQAVHDHRGAGRTAANLKHLLLPLSGHALQDDCESRVRSLLTTRRRRYFPAEIDVGFANETILVADQREGKPLSGKQGPLRLMCPNDKAGARSVRMLENLEIVRLRK